MLHAICDIVREAGQIILSAGDIAAKTHVKTSVADLVTEYDVAVENFLREKLLELLHGALFYGEEEALRGDPAKGWVFIVDPIDGTTNFVRGYQQSSISVALAQEGQVEYAVVYDPYREELFTAQRGVGAFLNGKPIRVSEKPIGEGIFLIGTAIYNRALIGPTMDLATQLFHRSCDFRRFGSAALDLCYVACGRGEVFFEYGLSPWDYSAGGLIVTEAGGVASTLEGAPLPVSGRSSVWACNAANRTLLGELRI